VLYRSLFPHGSEKQEGWTKKKREGSDEACWARRGNRLGEGEEESYKAENVKFTEWGSSSQSMGRGDAFLRDGNNEE